MFGIIAQISVFIAVLFFLVYFLGEYLAWIFRDQVGSRGGLPSWLGWMEKLDRLFSPIENFMYKVLGLDTGEGMDWRRYLFSVFAFNSVLFLFIILIFKFQGVLPLNPLGLSGMSWDQAFHTASTFVANTNQQHYAGESLSYFSQVFGVLLAMFMSAATGLSLAVGFSRGIMNEEDENLGNFYENLVRGSVRFLLPLTLIVGIFLVSQGVPQTLGGQVTAETIGGGEQFIRIGPVAGVESIKMIGTNGGGYFAANAAHPFENPTILSNLILNLFLLAVPISVIYAFGVWIGKRWHAGVLIGAFFILFMGLLFLSVSGEIQPNSAVEVSTTNAGVIQPYGNMEGKEVRFGPVLSALWGVSTTSTTNGAVNSMHNSYTAQGSLPLFFAMSMNCLYNGIGVGLLNLMTFLFIAVFIGGLMIGRAPQYLGKRIEWMEIKIAALIILLLPALVLIPTSIAVATRFGKEAITNPGFRGFAEILYEMFSASANNGSGFEGLLDNTPFFNFTNGIQILLGRYLPIAGQIAIAGSLAKKKIRPETEGTLKVESTAFLILFIGTMIVIGALIFLPSLSVGPLGEFLQGGF
ncbi:ATPase [candidate division MSBL1 archaeon SCGC-AAA259I09]|uniref:Potassium-transporting ATPase potassium-binding subunit n=2 Tax=candidate division MSBL1 TaxID=215777 RepID=A0A133UPK1_9EURY|nr:ATPase [candidate division MSBL1 archaeon SCGC-AAA259B11]KXA96093.1 ATPase [candidate division MSBL1 archaeon SCGC-AAA259I09]